MAPLPLSVSAPIVSPPPRYLRRPVIAASGAVLAALLFLTAAAAVWRPDYLPAALLRRSAPAAPAARLFQVTWLKNDGFIYDRHNFSKRERFTHKMRDGWGLATDGKVLFGSDGTSRLYHLDPESLEVTKTVTVKYQDNEVSYINELEYINAEVWANVWQTDCIARVSHEDGLVLSWIFLHELRQHLLDTDYRAVDVLNGIAWDEENQRLFDSSMVNFDKLCEVYASDLAQGGSAKGPGEQEVAEDESPVHAEPASEPNKKNVAQAQDNTNPSGSSRQGRKRTYPDDEAAELGLVSVSNTLAKFLEAEQENAKTMSGLQKALFHEAEVHEQTSANRTKLLDILQNLEDLTDEEVVMAVRVIGRDAGQTELFLKMRDKYQVVFVRQELEAAKK
ncbi:hypothetical protein ACQ4PT_007476 [Festuca glaucescens]